MKGEPRELTIAAPLVRYLRSGVKREMSTALSKMQLQVDIAMDRDTWDVLLERFDSARTLLETIGPVDNPEQQDVVLDLSNWPQLVLRALEREHVSEVRRLRDAEVEGFSLPPRDVPALGQLVEEVRVRTRAPRKRRRHLSFLEAQVAGRKVERRRRGDRK